MYSTICLFTPTFPWRLTRPQWCWARRPTAIPTPFYSEKTTVILRLRRINFWTEKAIILAVLEGDFEHLSGKQSFTSVHLCVKAVWTNFVEILPTMEISPKFRKPRCLWSVPDVHARSFVLGFLIEKTNYSINSKISFVVVNILYLWRNQVIPQLLKVAFNTHLYSCCVK